MGKDDSSVKKRRKLQSSSSVSETIKLTPSDVYKKAVEFEETEAQLRSAEKDAAQYKKFCQEIREILADISELKLKNTDEAKEKINEKRVQASLLIVALKKLNRCEKVRTKAGRDALNKEKQRVDSTHLLLQNLLYEADHLNKEVTKCLQFKSKHEEIELVPIEEFYNEAPPEISRPEVTKSNEHELQLARLEWELRQRRDLAAKCSELVGSKERVAAAIAATRSRLEALSPQVRAVLAATRPLQECLALRLDERREEARAAALLPPPLFLLLANASAYADAFPTHALHAAICGDEDEARRFEDSQEELDISESESDQEPIDEEPRDKKKRHHRSTKVSKEEKAETKKKEVLKKHPLTVQLTIKIKDGTVLSLVFAYLVHLKIVTVKSTVSVPKPVTGVSAADVLNGHSILHVLYPEDTGADSPHPATAYVFKSAKISGDFQQFIPELGRPYIWAQRLCGLDFMAALSDTRKLKTVTPSQDLSVVSVENVIVTLRRRLKSRVELMKELQELESGKIPPFEGNASIRISGSLTQWQAIAWAEYCQSQSTALLISEGIVTANDLLYRAIITRQSAKLVALVALKSEYPKKRPVFSLTLHWNGTHHSGTDDDIRDIERIMNTDMGDTNDKQSLSSQLSRLLVYLDILLEAVGSSEFPPDKVMFRPVRGRTRSKPYKFLKQGTGMFTQY